MEILFCYLVPWVMAAGVFQAVVTASPGLPPIARIPLWLAAIVIVPGIVFAGMWASYVFFPDGEEATKVAAHHLSQLSGDMLDVRNLLPDEYERLLAAVRQSPDKVTHETAETLDPPLSLVIRRIQQVASNADDSLLLDVWRKSLEFDRELASMAVNRCATRSIGHMLLPRAHSQDITEAEMAFWRARRDAFVAGTAARRPAISENEGLDAILSVAREPEYDALWNPPADPDDARICILRIRFAEAALAAPQGPTAIRFLYSRGYQ